MTDDYASRAAWDSAQVGLNANFLRRVQDEIERLRAENEKLRHEIDAETDQARKDVAYFDELRADNEKLRAKCEFIYDELLEAKGQVEKLQKSLQDMTIRYSESIDEKVGLRGDNEKLATKQFVLDAVILSLHEDIEDLRAAMHDIYEVYAGSEGFHPQTCLEVYLQKHIKEMADIAAVHKRAAAAALKEMGDGTLV